MYLLHLVEKFNFLRKQKEESLTAVLFKQQRKIGPQ